MKHQATRGEIFFALSFVIVQIAVKSVAGNLSYANKNIVKITFYPTFSPTRYQQASAYRSTNYNYALKLSNNVTIPREINKINAYVTSHRESGTGHRSGNYSQDKYKLGYNHEAFPKASQIKKWQVGRVSRKQYEIINMVWRKTKIFDDVESTTAKYHFNQYNDTIRNIRQPFNRFSSRPSLSSTTPSFIEFYYLDETDERVKQASTQKHIQVTTVTENRIRNHGNHKFVLSDAPTFSFRIHDPSYKRPALTNRYAQETNKIKRRKARTYESSLTRFDSLNSLTPSYKFPLKRTEQNKFVTFSTASNRKSNATLKITSSTSSTTTTTTTTEYYDNETSPTTIDIDLINDKTESENISSETVNVTQAQKSTTAYDKIKFFELYDKLTPVPYYDEKGRYDTDNVDIFLKDNKLESKLILEHVDQSIGNEHSQTHKAKPAKKHIIDAYKKESNNQSNANSEVITKVKPILIPSDVNKNVTKQPVIKLLQSELEVSPLVEYRKSQNVEWYQYPFAAAYVYEPLQVHCDAAGISPHWLITSGSCLSRHHKNPSGEGRSAFVTYCGVSWWNPERVAYVKYSLVHPRFHHRDKTRRHLYNIGLIQVVNSMASACTGWSSISLMSHQIAGDGEGETANAIGWGLDRFDTRYSSSELPKMPLMSYENQVYSHSCPGNIGYGKAKRLDEEGGIKNVYCLALPPYLGEAADPVHGGILLVGGKLVALYLQEERRPWGDQCAQYTGTWRLVPWILDVARENDDVDSFTLDI